MNLKSCNHAFKTGHEAHLLQSCGYFRAAEKFEDVWVPSRDQMILAESYFARIMREAT